MLSRKSFIFCQATLERSTWKGHVHKCYTGIGNLLCLNIKVFSKVVNNLNWNCKHLHFECLWILAGLNVLLWPLVSCMELMTMQNVTYRIKVSWSLWINVSKIFAFVYSTNTQCKFLLHLRWLLCWKEEAVHFRLNAINNVFFCVTDPQIRSWKCVVGAGGGVPYISCVVIVYVPFQQVCFVNPWFQTGCIVYSLAIWVWNILWGRVLCLLEQGCKTL